MVTYYYLLTVGIVLSQNNNDEGRPYEFGFTIDGQQHRHEKKDQNGIVQGEFGFITADGIYHVTVYATDENGNFKILSMRNIRISAPLDGSPATGPISPEAGKYQKNEKQIEATLAGSQSPQQLKYPQQQQSPQQKTGIFQQHSQKSLDSSQALEIVTRKLQPLVFTTRPTIKPACGGCGYVTTETALPKQKFQFQNSAFQLPVIGDNQHLLPTGVPIIQQVNQEFMQSPGNVLKKYQPEVAMFIPSIEPRVNSVNKITEINNIQNIEHRNLPYQQKMQYSQNMANENERLIPSNINKQNKEKYTISQNQQKFDARKNQNAAFSPILEDHNQSVNSFNQRNNHQRKNMSDVQGIKLIGTNSLPGGTLGPNPLLTSEDKISKIPPISVADNIIHVGGNKPIDIPIKDKYSGMVNGLPDGIEEKDIKDILYKFHYTVGFHGHYEKGLSNGAKIGGYFVNGRDGISRVVTYVADENGYRPKFKFINLGLDSPDTPKEETEHSFGLKNFEFIWYPIQ